MPLPTVPITDDSPISGIPTSESTAAEENRFLRLRMMEIWDAWANGKELPSAIPGFPELFPRASGTSNIPINYPNTPLGYPTISANFVGTPSEARPQVLASGAASNIFTAPPCSATAQPTLHRPSFDPSSFTFQAPSFPMEPTQFATSAYPQPPRYEFTVGQEKTAKTHEQEEITRKMRSMEQSLKNIQGLSGQKSVSYADLCMFPHVHLPLGFKTPKFEKYDGHGDPLAHLKRYCSQLWGSGGKEELLMAYFGESLVGIALEWQFQYNIDIARDMNSLSNLKKKSSESFREYAVKWREQAARVKPPMDKTEMVSVFLQAQEADYYQNMMSAMGKPFAEAIKIGEIVENGLKTGRILSQSAIRAISQAIQGGSGGVANRKKKEETAMATSSARKPRPPRSLFSERTPQDYYPHQDVAYAPQPYTVMNAQPYVRPQQQFNQNRAPLPRNQPPYQAHYNPRPPQNNFRAWEPLRKTNFTSIEGHDIDNCWTLKRAVEDLKEQKRILLRDEDIPNVTNNPLPAHNNGPIIGMICEDKEFDPALKAIIAIADVEKKPKAVANKTRGRKRAKPPLRRRKRKWKLKLGQHPPRMPFSMSPEAARKSRCH
ncbi:PREDICTED: uncharacterized protein LOC109235362 [Nicotiana attenuata]|uniref:uncharacterized protein LOC109235362 n=1 Tax=Nicotiana attenuata TaxID=49451 RepID=UPI00090521B8|nr:PREDICTED: uncharacterized protein LOC109235362 [Nicotiana attenuata]